MHTKFLLLLCFLMASSIKGQEIDYSYRDISLSFEERIDILLAQMTIEEKLSQMTHNNKAIPRLDIPAYGWWNEALHGVAYSGRATVFPQPIGLAASWNVDLLNKIGTAVSDEARAKHHDFVRKDKRNNFQGLTFWAPNINIFRDPRWGRGIETYGEDPYLTGRMGVAYIKGLQGDDEKYLKLVATPKHYAVHSGPEPDRHRFNATCNDKDLYETYLPHFKEAIQEGGAFSIMSAYNRFNGESCSGHPRLLTEILREEWGFKGVVVSDCAAIRDIYEFHKISESKEEAAAIGVKSGCDLNCGDYYQYLKGALEQGLVNEEDIDVALSRNFLARFKLGMFDPEEEVPYASIGMDVVNSKQNQALSLQAAKESIVLLKNDNNTLPLKSDLSKIAVIGPNANDLEVLLGNYNGLPFSASTPYEGIKVRAGENCEVVYAQGADWAPGVYVMEDLPQGFFFCEQDGKEIEGLKGEYFNDRYHKGTPIVTKVDKVLNFDWKDGSPAKGVWNDWFSIRWTGKLRVQNSGEYRIGGEGHHEYKIYINDSLHLEHREFYHQNTKKVAPIQLEAGKDYDIVVEFSTTAGDANFRMMWVPQNRRLKEKAVELAQSSDAVVMCMGLSPRLEGEELGIYIDGFAGGDRTKLALPENQLELIKEVAATGKPIVLVLLNGSALAINWEDENIPAIIDAWYPGQAAGEAISAVLFGDYNPSGKLPVTFYKSEDDLPPFEDYSMANRTYRYFNGEPLYPFGYGLSYSSFAYSNIKLPKKVKSGETVNVSVEVTNTSDCKGEEIVQVYVTNKNLGVGVPLPKLALKGFEKLKLEPGETKFVEFQLKAEHFAYVNAEGKSVMAPGEFTISVGGIQPGFECETTTSISEQLRIK